MFVSACECGWVDWLWTCGGADFGVGKALDISVSMSVGVSMVGMVVGMGVSMCTCWYVCGASIHIHVCVGLDAGAMVRIRVVMDMGAVLGVIVVFG